MCICLVGFLEEASSVNSSIFTAHIGTLHISWASGQCDAKQQNSINLDAQTSGYLCQFMLPLLAQWEKPCSAVLWHWPASLWRWWLNYNKRGGNQEQNSLAEVGPNSQSNTVLDFRAGITLTKSKWALHKGLVFLTCSVNSLVYSGAHLPFSAACATKNLGASKGCQTRNILTMTLGASNTLICCQTKPASHSCQPWR